MGIRIALVLGLAAVLSSGWWLWTDRQAVSEELASPPPVAVSGSVTVVEHVESVNGNLRIEIGEAPAVYAPDWTGLVGAVYLDEGVTLQDGMVVARIGQADRVVVESTEPFTRTLIAGDRGTDVAILQDYLVRHGFLAEPPPDPTFFHWKTSAAVKKFAESLGVVGAPREFDPAWVVWLPASHEIVVQSLHLIPGTLAPSTGQPLAVGRPRIHHSTFLTAGEATTMTGAWTLSTGEQQFAMVDGLLADDDVASILELSEPDPGAHIVDVSASATRDDVATSLSVPAVAVRSSSDAMTSCVFVRDNEEWVPLVVDVDSAPGSGVYVSSTEADLQQLEVLLNPTDVLRASLCH